MKYSAISAIFLILALVPVLAWADIVLIVSAESKTTELSKRELVNIYTGRNIIRPDGSRVEPFDQPLSSDLRARFYRQLLNKSVAEMNAYWARLLFTGRAKRPRQLDAAADSIEMIKSNPNAIVYIDSQSLGSHKQVRVVYTLSDE